MLSHEDREADLILVDEEHKVDLKKHYRLFKGEVRSPSWFQDCIREKRVQFSSYVVTKTPGRRTGLV